MPAYSIYIGTEILSQVLPAYCLELTQKLVIITDTNLRDTLGIQLQQYLQTAQLQADLLCFPAGEIHKTRDTKQILEDYLLQHKYGRDTCLIALGGGVVTDIVGFLASTYCRGIPVLYVPTTLLAMVDASIGGKTGVNTIFGKNLIGSFYQPQAVFMDLSGMPELIKHAMLADKDLFYQLNMNAQQIWNNEFLSESIYTSCCIKQSIVERDCKEQNIRQLLNFGHTIAHAIEAIENYKIAHGAAVAIGLLVEAYLSTLLGLLDNKYVVILEKTLRSYHLPLKTHAFNDMQKFLEQMQLDKKAVHNVPRFVLLKSIGEPQIVDQTVTFPVEMHILKQALEWSMMLCR